MSRVLIEERGTRQRPPLQLCHDHWWGIALIGPLPPPVAPAYEEAGQLVAMPDNEDNDELSEQQQLSNEVRDIIQFQDRVDIVVSLYKTGQTTNLAKTIESVFRCSRTSKEESTYQRAKRAIDPLIAKPVAPTPIAGRPTSAVFQSDMEEVV